LNKKQSLKPYLCILPSFALIAVFYYYAVVYAVGLSLTDTNLGIGGKFIWFNNFIRLFGDDVFKKSISNLSMFAVTDLLKALLFPLIAAELICFVKSKAKSEFLKKILIFPMLVPGMVTMMLWYNMLDPNIGAVNQVLGKIGLTGLQHNWFFDPKTAIWSIISIGFPFIAGLNFLIFHTALNSISKEHIEAATLDGSTSLDLVRYLHIPTVIPYAGTVATLAIIGSLQDYARVLVTTRGGPGYETYVPALIMYNNMNNEIGYAAAAGVFCFILILIATLIIRFVVNTLDKSLGGT
jgi:raffinose/stachyose/melibiose transport system permease protein